MHVIYNTIRVFSVITRLALYKKLHNNYIADYVMRQRLSLSLSLSLSLLVRK